MDAATALLAVLREQVHALLDQNMALAAENRALKAGIAKSATEAPQPETSQSAPTPTESAEAGRRE